MLSRAHQKKHRSSVFTAVVALAAMLGFSPAVCAAPAPANTAANVAPLSGAGDDWLTVDCLLPGKVRSLGTRSVYMTARKPAVITVRECRLKGGEYVVEDRASMGGSLKFWLPAAEAGDLEALTMVGQIYEAGVNGKSQPGLAVEYYKRAAQAGHAPAQFALARMYDDGVGVPRSRETAAEWYRRSYGLSEDQLADVVRFVDSDEVAALKAEISQQADQIGALKIEIAQLETELAACKARLASADAEIATLTAALQAKESELARLHSETASARRALAAARASAPALAAADTTALRQVTAEQARLDALRTELVARETALAAREKGLTARAGDLVAGLADRLTVAADRKALKDEQAALADARAALDTRLADAGAREARLASLDGDLGRLRADLEKRLGALAAQQDALARREREFIDQREAAARAEASYRRQSAELASLRTAAATPAPATGASDLARREQALAALKAEVESARTRLAASERDLASQRQALDAGRAALSRASADHADRLAAADALTRDAKAAAAEVAAERARLAEREKALAARERAALATASGAGAALAASQRQLEADRAAIRADRAALDTLAAKLEAQRAAVTASARRLADKLAAQAAREKGLASRESDLDAGEKTLAQARQSVAAAQAAQEERIRQAAKDRQLERETSARHVAAKQRLNQSPSIELFKPGPNRSGMRAPGVVKTGASTDPNRIEIVGRYATPRGFRKLEVNGKQVSPGPDNTFTHTASVDDIRASNNHILVRVEDVSGESARVMLHMGSATRGRTEIVSQTSAQGKTTPLRRADFGKFHAIVIGNSKYTHWQDLQNPHRDVDAVAKVLQDQYGFEVKVLKDVDRVAMLREIGSLASAMGGTDNLLIYFAGHGTYDEASRTAYWVPVDGEVTVQDNWISSNDISNKLRASAARKILVVSDSCYAGGMMRGGDVPTSIALGLSKKSRKFLAAVGMNQALDYDPSVPEQTSVFRRAFADVLARNRNVIAAESVYQQVREQVIERADLVGAYQEPQYGALSQASHEGGDFVFVPKDWR